MTSQSRWATLGTLVGVALALACVWPLLIGGLHAPPPWVWSIASLAWVLGATAVAGALLWKLLREHQARRRSEFSLRELRLAGEDDVILVGLAYGYWEGAQLQAQCRHAGFAEQGLKVGDADAHDRTQAVLAMQQGLAFSPPTMLVRDADTQVRWYYRLKREWLAAQAEGRAPVNSLAPVTLKWRS